MADQAVNPKELAATRDRKAPLHLIEVEAEEMIAWAMQNGADKYGERNYQTIPISASGYVGAMRRHLGAWLAGEENAPDSGVHHLAHVGANINIILWAIAHGNLRDDRGPRARTEEQETAMLASNSAGGVKAPEPQ